MDTCKQRRLQMVEQQLAARDIEDERVLAAMRAVPREAFVPEALLGQAYADGPLPIGSGQTISQPYIVALMREALKLSGDERVLEIGTGSGYAAAVLGHLAARVDTVERLPELAERADLQLRGLGLEQVHVHCADGSLGWPESAPYDAIVVAAGGPSVPEALKAQLAPGGRLVIPVGSGTGWQELVRVTRIGDEDFHREQLGDVAFVPLIGEQGWPRRQ
jgi:protein-L-isoaspartate(D-aspartate) O-methyltransferase